LIKESAIGGHETDHEDHHKCPLTILSHYFFKKEIRQDDWVRGLISYRVELEEGTINVAS
jgi:hypothetical protein